MTAKERNRLSQSNCCHLPSQQFDWLFECRTEFPTTGQLFRRCRGSCGYGGFGIWHPCRNSYVRVRLARRGARRPGGRGASSAWHISQMGPPYRSDFWAWAQSGVRRWSFRSGGGACSCRFLVDNCLQIEQARTAPENENRANTESAGGGTV